ncbi:MAG: prepilin-type N-terminal cleavage/methylation domain-containing protein [Candidatus Accumulibacter sp.]|nr:prepilin-type N-terminal cleavage/methylation domain-containing protein [Accumulibacter sp.]
MGAANIFSERRGKKQGTAGFLLSFSLPCSPGGAAAPTPPAAIGNRFSPRLARPRGFTLIELLVVCGILAALAFTAWGAYNGVQEAAEDDIALADLRRVADAVRRFRADTGFYPGQGPFALAATAQVEAQCTAADGILRSWAAHLPDGDRNAWFASPANLALLFGAPILCAKHPLAHLQKWNPETGRGWRGPYLDRNLRLWVDHGDALNSRTVDTIGSDGETVVTDGPDGFGDPLIGVKIRDVPAYGTGPRYRAAGAAGAACSGQGATSGGCMFGWRAAARWETGYRADVHELERHARPFLLFGLANGDHPRVVYLGKDGVYGGRNPDDPCRPNLNTSGGADDHVLCLDGG